MKTSKPIALVHDWVERVGGAERVLDQFANLFPQADLYVLWSDILDRYSLNTFESVLSRTPLRRHKALSLPLQPGIWRTLGNSEVTYQKLLVSSHLFAHHARFPDSPNAEKYVYVHTPARYIWEPDRDTRGQGLLTQFASKILRQLDKRRATESLGLVANSTFTQQQIQRFWERESLVINPPVRVRWLQSLAKDAPELDQAEYESLINLPETFILGASRFVDYKKLEKVIELGEWVDLPVVLAGSGPREKYFEYLASKASVPVQIIKSPSDVLLAHLFQRAYAYVFPAIEDFGIMPVEASAAGTPVLANFLGGSADSIVDGINGFRVDMESKESTLTGFRRLESISSEDSKKHALQFDESEFRLKIKSWIGST